MRQFSFAIGWLALAMLPARAGAQPIAIGSEFQINTATASGQNLPAVASSSAGDFVVVWNRVTPMSTTAVLSQRFSSDGQALGSEFQVNAVSSPYFDFPTVAVDAVGDFLIAWSGVDGDNGGIRAQRYASNGNPNGSEFQINTTTYYFQFQPRAALDPTGGFIVVWTDGSNSGPDIAGQRYDAAGTPRGTEFVVNIGGYNSQRPATAADDAGNFVVVWQQDGIRGRRFGSNGALLGSEFQVSSVTTDPAIEFTHPDVAADGPGNFVIGWVMRDTYEAYRPNDIMVRRYSSDGAPTTSEFRVNDTGYFGFYPNLAVGSTGNFVVTWSAYTQSYDPTDIFARRLGNSGSPVGPQFRVASTSTALRSTSDVAFTAANEFVVVWQEKTTFASEPDILGRRFAGSVSTPFCTAGAPIGSGAQVKLSKLSAPAGDEKLLIKGALQLPTDFPSPFDPAATGAQIVIEDLGNGTATIFALSHLGQPVPPGGGCGPKDGWKANGAGTRFKYLNKTGAMPPGCVAGSAKGLALIKLKDDRATKGIVSFKIKAKDATIGAPVGPLRVTFVLGADAAAGASGECGAVAFTSGQCGASGSAYKCR